MKSGLSATALCAGLFAALASVFGKLAMDGGPAEVFCCHYFLDCLTDSAFSTKVIYAVRLGLFGMVFVSNALMWSLFSKALAQSTSTLQVTVTNSSANFLFTALFGKFLFGETLPLLWWIGFSCILSGLVLVGRGSVSATAASHDKKAN